MNQESECHAVHEKPSTWRHKLAFVGFLTISLVYLALEHTVHLLGVLSYFLLIVSSLMHFLNQAGHDIHDGPKGPTP